MADRGSAGDAQARSRFDGMITCLAVQCGVTPTTPCTLGAIQGPCASQHQACLADDGRGS